MDDIPLLDCQSYPGDKCMLPCDQRVYKLPLGCRGNYSDRDLHRLDFHMPWLADTHSQMNIQFQQEWLEQKQKKKEYSHKTKVMNMKNTTKIKYLFFHSEHLPSQSNLACRYKP